MSVFWAPGSGFVGFRRTGWCAQGWAESSKPSADARGGEFGGVAGSFPGQAVVVDEPAGQAGLPQFVGIFGVSGTRFAWSGAWVGR